jgi:uncharacterized protein (DUF1697 family)
MMTHIALLRGINVGKAKRIAMADLREIFVELGYENVRTLLNSGNVIFDSPRKITAAKTKAKAKEIRDTVFAKTAVMSEVVVISASDLAMVIAENPLASIANDPSRYLVAFPASPADLAKADAMAQKDWSPDRIVIGSKAAYIWCASGVLESKAAKEFGRALRDAVTARNWATVTKLHELADSE